MTVRRRPSAGVRLGRRRGVVLLAVLVVVVLLSLAAYQFGELMSAEYHAVDSAVRAAQARAAAASGLHYAAAVLADPETLAVRLNNNPFDTNEFQAVEVRSSDMPRWRGRFSIFAPPDPDSAGTGDFRSGVTDESAKININALARLDSSGRVAHDVLTRLPNMTEEVADAIIDWIDADDEQRANGAENAFYSGQDPPRRCKNGPLDSIDELLLVRGVTPELLYGTDRNRNGMADRDEPDSANGFNAGWAAYLTVYSRERNQSADGSDRIYLNDSNLSQLGTDLTAAVGEELANFILAYRLYGPYEPRPGSAPAQPGGQLSREQLDLGRRPQSIPSVFALVDARVAVQSQQPSPQPRGGGSAKAGAPPVSVTRVYNSPLNDPAKQRQYLPILLDRFTTRRDAELPARVNVNTAPREVLLALPGLDESDVQAILERRPPPGTTNEAVYQSAAWLLTEAQLSADKVRALERYVTANTKTYRLQVLGYFDRGGPVVRYEGVIDTHGNVPRFVMIRDLTELGRGFPLPR